MKFSFLMPYYNRPELHHTLDSFLKLYVGRNDYEVILVEDRKTLAIVEQHEKLHKIIEQFSPYIQITYRENDIESYSCCRPYNIAGMAAQGEFVIITNPECMHETNILQGLDEEFSKNRNSYIICSNKAMWFNNKNELEFKMWYQHSEYNNRKLHFCSAITKENWDKLGGFNEDYKYGCAFEDDDWLERVMTLNIPIITRDDLITIHIEHDRGYLTSALIERNRQLYNMLWGRNR